MSGVWSGRYVADLEGDFVVFLIGMRINKPWKPHRWLPVYRAMGRMLAELERQPDKGLLGWERALIGGPAVVQYWRSFAHLERFARDPGDLHVPAWKEWNRAVRDSGDVGVWHETYQLRAGEYEAIYDNMPRFRLAAAGDHLPIGRKGLSAARRIGLRDDDALVVPDPAYPAEAHPSAPSGGSTSRLRALCPPRDPTGRDPHQRNPRACAPPFTDDSFPAAAKAITRCAASSRAAAVRSRAAHRRDRGTAWRARASRP